MKFFRYSTVKSNVYMSFGVAMLLFIIIGYVFYWSTTKFIESSRWIAHTQEVVSDLRIVSVGRFRDRTTRLSLNKQGELFGTI